ncbi:DUF4238 domain-containing protein [Sphingobacterium faecium]|uniref:DUF4238 domain-containing protein n=1 Tax=Sphingobacterium faecium TaxID=34087 RepID=UPI00247AD8E1|nr:DUF4238 domain-containing protein [Sphingobacterium faecium]WGQ15451.1 DUF4238 domain-containing protein [Sphingobacterium faecium]
MQITKAQHFVWRKYLENWCINKQLFTKDLSTGKIFNVNPQNFLKENYIYSIPILSFNELMEIERHVNQLSNSSSKDINFKFFKLLSDLSILKALTQIDDEVDVTSYEKNGLEDFYTQIEYYGKDLISVKSIDDLEEILRFDQNKILNFILFQYTRTQNMRDKLRKLISSEPENVRRAKELLTPIIMSNNVLCTPNQSVKFKILNNQTNLTFITSDQPASNLKYNSLDGAGNVKEFVVMYPINPHLLLIIDFNFNDDQGLDIVSCDSKTVLYYNKQIELNSNKFLISSNSEQFNIE